MPVEQLRLHCDCNPVFETRFDPASGISPTGAVVEAIAAASDVEPIDLPPLSESIDPDALDALFRNAGDETDSNGVVLGFAVGDWNVFLRGDGQIRVCDPSEPREVTASSGAVDRARTD